jgi:hypothetical protein
MLGERVAPAAGPLHVSVRQLAEYCYCLPQEYVRARIVQFAGAFARRINPTLDVQIIQQAAAEAIASLPAPEYGRVAVENRDLQLVYRHDCLCDPLPSQFVKRWDSFSSPGGLDITAQVHRDLTKRTLQANKLAISRPS